MTRRSTVSVRNALRVPSLRPGRSSLVAMVALLASLLASVLVPGSASADQIADKRAQAARLAAQIERNYDRMSTLDEEVLAAQHRIAALQTEIAQTQRKAVTAHNQMDSLQLELANRAASLYRNAGTSSLGDTTSSLQEAGARSVYAQTAAAQDREMIDRFRRARDAAQATEARLATAQKEAQAQAKAAADARAELKRTNEAQQRLLADTKGELATLLAQEQARIAAAQEREARRKDAEARQRERAQQQREQDNQNRTNSNNGGVGNGGGSHTTPPPSHIVARNPRAQIAIDTAMAQIGKWYKFAATGPNQFDCSGLLVYSWARAGVSLPHSSRALYASLPKIPKSSLMPGDFVYYGSPIHHVGMYIGGGMMVEAPHTGARVRTRSIYRNDYAGATRVP
jgi:peptidoglycan DL-endopeptidase CwlO